VSREERIVSKLEGAYDFLEFVNDNYPDVISEWKNKSGLGNPNPNTTDADINNPEPPGDAYTSG
jgi:hypothetical protein